MVNGSDDRTIEDRVAALEGSLSALLSNMRELVSDVGFLVSELKISGDLSADAFEVLQPSLNALDAFFTAALEFFLPEGVVRERPTPPIDES